MKMMLCLKIFAAIILGWAYFTLEDKLTSSHFISKENFEILSMIIGFFIYWIHAWLRDIADGMNRMESKINNIEDRIKNKKYYQIMD